MEGKTNRLFPLEGIDEEVKEVKQTRGFASFHTAEPEDQTKLEAFLSSDEEIGDQTCLNVNETERPSFQTSTSLTRQKRRREKEDRKDMFVDKNGDRQILFYQGHYRLDVPSYRCTVTAFGRETNIRRLSQEERYYAYKQLSKEKSRKLRRLTLCDRHCQALQTTQPESIIPIVSALQQQEQIAIENVEDRVIRRTKEINIRLRDDPYDLSLWLEFARFQDEAIALTRRRISTTSTVEKKLSILSKALHFHPQSEELLCQLLQLTSMISSPDACSEKYQAILSRMPHSLPLWESYWLYVKTIFISFSCEKMREAYEGGFKGIHAAIQSRAEVMYQTVRVEEDLVRAFLSGVLFDLQSGYEEKAVAKIQMALEWIFCQSENMRSLSEESLQVLFQRFWESSSISKIGEKNVNGFGHFVDGHMVDIDDAVSEGSRRKTSTMDSKPTVAENNGWSGWFDLGHEIGDDIQQEMDTTSEEEVSEEEEAETETDLIKELGMKLEELETTTSLAPEVVESFLQTEKDRTARGCMPSKRESSTELDVDGLVLYEELQPLQFDLHHDSSKKKLLLGALNILGVDVSELTCSNDAFFSSLRAEVDTRSSGILDDMESIIGQPSMPCRWHNSSLLRFVDNLLEFFATRLFGSDIRIRKIWFRAAIEAISETDGITDVDFTQPGRRILENHKNDLLLWVAYGSVLFDNNRVKESERVWMAVLKTLLTRSESCSADMSISIVFEILESSIPTMLHLHLLVFAATGDKNHLDEYRSKVKKKEFSDIAINASTIQSCRNSFRSEAGKAMSSELTWDGFERIICRIYLESLLQMHSEKHFTTERFYSILANQAGYVIENIARTLVVQSRQDEALYERYCCWLSKSGRPAKELKKEIMRCLQLFPASTNLIRLYVHIHVKAHTIASLLAEMKTHIFDKPRIETLSLLPAIEKHRSLNFVSMPSLFERMFKQHEECRHSPFIWLQYLEFSANLKGDDFKRVFLRGIQACPWSKKLWLQGLELNQGRFTGKEIAGFIETMKEKGLRLRTDIFEILLEEGEGTL